MHLTFEWQADVCIACPQGGLGFAEAALAQQALERAIAAAGPTLRGLVMDCTALDAISSAGLRVWLLIARAAKSASLLFVVCSLHDTAAEVFAISGFNTLIPAYADRAAALAAIQATAA